MSSAQLRRYYEEQVINVRDRDYEDNAALLPRPNAPHAFQRSPLSRACTVCAANRRDPAGLHRYEDRFTF